MIKNGYGQSGLVSKINCISKLNRWNELIFYMPVQIQES